MAKRLKKNMDIKPEQSAEEGVRLNKYLSDAGICSRREADRYIEQGLVTVDGKKAATGTRIKAGEKVCFKGKPVVKEDKLVLIVFHKPRGIVCTSEKREPNNIIDYIHYPSRIYPIGRLDKDSEGIILLTNHGDLANRISKARYYHEKEYLVTVNKPLTDDFIHKMAQGVPILNTITRKCKILKEDKYTFRIVLTQGLNRQIRRMCEALGYYVVALKRVRIMNIQLGKLKAGQYRNVTDRELQTLNKMLNGEGSHGRTNKKDEGAYRTSR